MISAKAGPTESCREEAIFLQDLWEESLIWFLCVHSWTLCNINLIMAFPSLTPFCASPLLLGSKPESFNWPPGPCIICPCMIFLTSNPFTHPLFSPLLCLTLSHSWTVCTGLYLDHSFPPSFVLFAQWTSTHTSYLSSNGASLSPLSLQGKVPLWYVLYTLYPLKLNRYLWNYLFSVSLLN